MVSPSNHADAAKVKKSCISWIWLTRAMPPSDDNEILAGCAAEILEAVAKVAAIKKKITGFDDMRCATERHLQAPLRYVEMFFDALAMRREWPFQLKW
jgi:hypothetical protein